MWQYKKKFLLDLLYSLELPNCFQESGLNADFYDPANEPMSCSEMYSRGYLEYFLGTLEISFSFLFYKMTDHMSSGSSSDEYLAWSKFFSLEF